MSSRIIRRLALTTLVATAAAYGWLYVKQLHVEAYLWERSLVRQAQEISEFISVDPNGVIRVDLPPELAESYDSPDSRYRYAVRDAAGRIVMSSGQRVGPLPHFVASANQGTYESRNAENGYTLGGAYQKIIDQQIFVTQVEQTAPTKRSLNAAVFNEFFIDGGWLGIPFLIALLVISALTVRRSLAPLHELSSIASRIDPGNSDLRLPQTNIPDEVLPLVHSVNSALDRLDEGLKRQRELNAISAHQLRTSLAVLAANLDVMNDRSMANKLRYDVDVMSRIVTQLLLVARLETLEIRRDEVVDLCAVASEIAENLSPLAISMQKTLEVDAPPRPVHITGSRFLMGVAVNNLVDNALRHTPAGGMIRICVTSMPSIEVRDSGPGIPSDMRGKIFQRFWKGKESNHGAGLGLSIVRRVMSLIHGDVTISDAPEGGAQFTLSFRESAGPIQVTRAERARIDVEASFSNSRNQ